jgi:hypothetical protein
VLVAHRVDDDGPGARLVRELDGGQIVHRAERLAEKYYRRYGTFECSDSDSEDSVLSVDSEGNRPEGEDLNEEGGK